MKILNVNMSIDPVKGGGTAERTLQISRTLAKMGHHCTILTTDAGLCPDYIRNCEKFDFEVVVLPSLWERFYLSRPYQRLIRNLVKKADVVQLMSHWTLINALVYRAIKALAKPYAVCPAGALPIFGRSRILKKLYNYIIGREMIRHADACIAISPNEMDHFKSYGVLPGRVSVIPNGVNPGDFPEGDGEIFRTRLNIGNAPVILFMGRLNIIKGPDMLLEAFCRCSQEEQMKPYHLVFAGPDGGLLNELKRMVDASDVKDRVHFPGHIGGAEKSDAYRAAGFLVIPSRQEAMSIVVLEAGITGTPALITDQCGFNDVATVEGGMVVEASVEGLRVGMLAMTGNAEKLKVMGQNLKEYTEDRFLWDHMVKRHLELFSQIVH